MKKALLALLVVVLTSCGKYEQGPELSLRTKTARLTGVWELVEFNDRPYKGLEFDFRKNSDLYVTEEGLSGPVTLKGKWEWAEDKEQIAISLDGIRGKVKILRLTNSELWLEDEDIDKYEFEKK